MRYSKRLADSILKEMLEAKGAVLVSGAEVKDPNAFVKAMNALLSK